MGRMADGWLGLGRLGLVMADALRVCPIIYGLWLMARLLRMTYGHGHQEPVVINPQKTSQNVRSMQAEPTGQLTR